MTLDPKALVDAFNAFGTEARATDSNIVDAIQAYLDAADLVPRVQMDNAVSKKLMAAIDERDEARREAAAWKKDAEERLPRHVYQEVCDLNVSQGKQLAALRKVLNRLINKVNRLGWPADPLIECKHGIAPVQGWLNIHSLKGCIEQASAALTDTAEAAAQWVRVPTLEAIARGIYANEAGSMRLDDDAFDDLEEADKLLYFVRAKGAHNAWLAAAPQAGEPEDG